MPKQTAFGLPPMSSGFSHRPARTWRKLMITAPAFLTDALAGLLASITGQGVEVGATEKGPGQTVEEVIIGYLAEEDQDLQEKEQRLRRELAALQALHPQAGLVLHTAELTEEDWSKTWKEHFKPLPLSPRITVKPSWEPYTTREEELVIEIDPGLAFGTGHHASTRLALQLLEKCYPLGEKGPQAVLDVGTGTGILAMACILLGARQGWALDNDPDAVAAARQNIDSNHLEQQLQASSRELSSMEEQFELVVANITTDILLLLAPMLRARLCPGGWLILSGILQGEQAEQIRRRFGKLGLKPMEELENGEWAAFRFRLPKETA